MAYQLTPEHAKLWLPVVRELREYYEGKNDKFINFCPLCIVAGKIKGEQYLNDCSLCSVSRNHFYPYDCIYCLWNIFESIKCDRFDKKILIKRIERPTSWCEQSIARLKRWERRLEEIIKGEKRNE